MDRSKDHRIFLDRSNSFLHPSCPYWFGPSPLRCAPVVLIKQQAIYPPQNEARQKKTGKKERKEEREDKEEKTEKKKKKNFRQSLWQKDNKGGKKTDATTYAKDPSVTWSVPTCYMDIWKGHSISLNLLNFSRPPSCLGWYGSCHLQHDQVVLVRTKGWQQWNKFYWLFYFGVVNTIKLDVAYLTLTGTACIWVALLTAKWSLY